MEADVFQVFNLGCVFGFAVAGGIALGHSAYVSWLHREQD